ncbi:MAG: hypothetical protein JXA23_03645, partial [Bacteroidales bacterium]|nr:hypothetical protein [Bacteroidales bacterium]
MERFWFLSIVASLSAFHFPAAAQNYALEFDGTEDYISFSSAPSSVQTVECWVYPSTNNQKLFQLNASCYVEIISGTLTATGFTDSTLFVNGLSGVTGVAQGVWSHIAITTATRINASAFELGRIGTGYLNGKLDEVRLWSDVRKETEIIEYMCQTLNGNENGLVAHYQFNETIGSVLTDNTSNDFDGTLQFMENEDWVDSEAFTTWTGSTSSDWAVASNWTDSVPDFNDNTGIPSTGNSPSITANIETNLLVVDSAATLDFSYSGSHTIHGNVFNIGTTNLNPGTHLTITGSLFMLHTSHLNIKPLADLTIGQNLYTRILGLDGTLTIESNNTGTGSLIVNGSSTGNVTTQRYIPAATWTTWDDGWHLISSPVPDYPIQDNFTVSPADEYDFYAWSEP